MTAKLTAEERAAMLTRVRVFWCQELHADYWTNEEVTEVVAKEVERDREQRAGDNEQWEKLAGERFDQIAAMHCKLADVSALCRSILAVDSGSNGFSGVQKLAARVLEIVDEQPKEAAK